MFRECRVHVLFFSSVSHISVFILRFNFKNAAASPSMIIFLFISF